MSDNGAPAATDSAAEADPLPALPIQKESDPDWASTDPPGQPAPDTDPKQAVPMQKPAPMWAQTVPESPDERAGADPQTASSAEETPASQSPENQFAKRSWPPAGGRAQEAVPVREQGALQEDVAPAQGAVPDETDIWPPEPPTEQNMPAWPPSSTEL